MRRFLLCLLLAACVPPRSYPIGDAGAASAQVCGQLRTLNCDEGRPNAKTGETCEHFYTAHLAVIDGECITSSMSVNDVRLCGVECQ